MTGVIETRITFRKQEDGGRRAMPSGKSYRPHLVVDNSEVYLGVNFIEISSDSQLGVEYRQKMGLLYDMPEYRLLKKGSRFSIMEGPHLVGEGYVL